MSAGRKETQYTLREKSRFGVHCPLNCGISASFQYLLVLHLVFALAFSFLNHLLETEIPNFRVCMMSVSECWRNSITF